MNKALFGVDCTGCGAQRAVVLLFKGEFTQAFLMYPAIYSIAILLAFLVFNLFYKFKFDYNIKIGLIIFNGLLIAGAYVFKMFQTFN